MYSPDSQGETEKSSITFQKEAVAEGAQMGKEQAMVCEILAMFRQPSVLAKSMLCSCISFPL